MIAPTDSPALHFSMPSSDISWSHDTVEAHVTEILAVGVMDWLGPSCRQLLERVYFAPSVWRWKYHRFYLPVILRVDGQGNLPLHTQSWTVMQAARVFGIPVVQAMDWLETAYEVQGGHLHPLGICPTGAMLSLSCSP